MSRTRLILLGLLAVVAVSVIATTSTSTPASASGSCSKVKTVAGYCVEGVPLESASAEIEGTDIGTSILKASIASVETEVKCEKGKVKGTIEGGVAGAVGKSAMTNTFEKCTLSKPANCELSPEDESEIKTASLAGELALTSGRLEDKLKPKLGSNFAVVIVEGQNNSCVISHVGEEEAVSITGSQLCEVDKNNTEAETEAKAHKLICKTSGSHLEIGTSSIPAEMTSEATVSLKSNKNWSIKET
jgi:hypothetical protein